MRVHLRKEKLSSLCRWGAEIQTRAEGQELGEPRFASNVSNGLSCQILLPLMPHFCHLKTLKSHVSLRILGFTERSAMEAVVISVLVTLNANCSKYAAGKPTDPKSCISKHYIFNAVWVGRVGRPKITGNKRGIIGVRACKDYWQCYLVHIIVGYEYWPTPSCPSMHNEKEEWNIRSVNPLLNNDVETK